MARIPHSQVDGHGKGDLSYSHPTSIVESVAQSRADNAYMASCPRLQVLIEDSHSFDSASTSISEAQASVSRLSLLVAQLVESNETMYRRMLANAAHSESAGSILFPPTDVAKDNKGSIDLENAHLDKPSDVATDEAQSLDPAEKTREPISEPDLVTQRAEFFDGMTSTSCLTFEKDLKASRPYLRALRRCSGGTLSSSIAPSMGWSYFSGISLADISCLSVVSLPIVPQDLWNGDRYLLSRSIPTSDTESHRSLQSLFSNRAILHQKEHLSTDAATIARIIEYRSLSGGYFGLGSNRDSLHLGCGKIVLLGMTSNSP